MGSCKTHIGKRIKTKSFANENNSENMASDTLTFGLYIGTSRSFRITLCKSVLTKMQLSQKEAQVG